MAEQVAKDADEAERLLAGLARLVEDQAWPAHHRCHTDMFCECRVMRILFDGTLCIQKARGVLALVEWCIW